MLLGRRELFGGDCRGEELDLAAANGRTNDTSRRGDWSRARDRRMILGLDAGLNHFVEERDEVVRVLEIDLLRNELLILLDDLSGRVDDVVRYARERVGYLNLWYRDLG